MREITTADIVRTAIRIERVWRIVERGAFAVVTGLGGAYIAARVILDDIWSRRRADDMKAEYDFTGGTRGKFYRR